MKAARLSVMMVGLMLVGVPAWAQDEGGATPDQADSAQEQEADSTASSAPRVKLETTLGDIVLELDGEKAPVSTHNFLQYTHDKFYDGTIFHRVMVGFMIQGGGFTVDMEKKEEGLRDQIINEWENGLKNEVGTVAMARLGGQPDSATSQFFINVVPNGRLDKPQRGGAAYAVFGRVVEGMETVEKIRNTEVATHPKYERGRAPHVPVEPVMIKSARILGEVDLAAYAARAETAVEERKQAKAAAEAAEKAAQEKALMDRIEKIEQEAGAKMTTTESGLMYVDLTVGEGASPEPTDTVEVHYRGTLLDGTEFDSSYKSGKPTTFRLNAVIKGWTEGVGGMKVGGKRMLVCPPDLAYGPRRKGPLIGPNTTLVFEVELVSIKGQEESSSAP
ncbi:MAG: peptidylprolyl isomerase [Planctomycetes bacterium]|nr:peptidylprolyl isomerase [Planctomycetota bacterium]